MIITGEQILSNITVVASIATVMGGIYAMFAKHSNTQVEIAKERSVGAKALAEIEKANAERDLELARIKGEVERNKNDEGRRNSEVSELRRLIQDYQRQSEQRQRDTDDRVVGILEDIARRNPYRRGGSSKGNYDHNNNEG